MEGKKLSRSKTIRGRKVKSRRAVPSSRQKAAGLYVLLGAVLGASPMTADSHTQMLKPKPTSNRKSVPVSSKTTRFPVGSVTAADLKRYRISRWVRGGVASWYGEAFAKRRTSSGTRFDPKAMTAAHRRLPLGSKVLVVDTQTHRSVIVTINDRGPYSHDRVIDLSHGAANRLGIVHRGLAHVRIALLTPSGERDDTPVEVAQAPE